MDMEQNLMFLAKDRDPRMRTTAVQGLELMCNNEWCLSLSSYQSLTKLCDDSEKNVRLSALRIVLAFAEKYTDHRIKTSKGFYISVQDDAFAVVCHAINDLEAQVRAEAARLLGCFLSVSDSFLHQTLDKKLMRQMRVTQTSGWSTGKKLGEDVPMEKDDEESQSLIPTGACGAFITALEDEFMAVRQAAVYSLGKLAKDRKDFARLCIDHLADMFNDEIQQVRLDAIRALAPLVCHGVLQQDQLHTILTVLDDATAENRVAIHDLISKSNMADAECVRQCIRVLLHSLKRFPLDKPSIYQCLSAIGLKHSLFVHGLVSELLEIHPIFDTPEQNIDDDFYLGKLILVLSGASQRPTICSLIPSYVRKHYRYLRYASPDLIPVVKEIDETNYVYWRPTKNLNSKEIVEACVRLANENYSENEIRFFAGLPVGILFKCQLYNIYENDLNSVRIEVTYPDQNITYFRPRRCDFYRLEDRQPHSCFRLNTTVIVTAAVWAVPADLRLRCGTISLGTKVKQFSPLADADNLPKFNKTFVKIHPVLRP